MTVALLHVLIHKIDNTTFGNDTPALPQWTGHPRTIFHIQAILFASLVLMLFDALATNDWTDVHWLTYAGPP